MGLKKKTKKVKIHEKQILSYVWLYLKKKDKLGKLFHNLYYFYDNSNELDLLQVNKVGYAVEYEIKSSEQDFKEDSLKVSKHSLLNKKDSSCPNKFYYVAPKGVITKDKLPKFAGLIEFYFNMYGECIFRTVKLAPLLHNSKIDVKDLYIKAYFKYDKIISSDLTKERARVKNELINNGQAVRRKAPVRRKKKK